ncbi:MAG TPA: dihydrofolate reductase family protein [Chloroflexota bacterium]|nr:dihydrofolate reductase family protein [Chloroflexota bacterium]
MGRITVNLSVTLDGVMQAPGRPDEDPRDGFAFGGWALPYADPEVGKRMSEGSDRIGALLFGRRTYLDFFGAWPGRTDGNPFTPVLNNSQKYVVSSTLREPLPWQNSTLLPGDAAASVPRLKREMDRDLLVLGSGVLVRSLLRQHLVDDLVLQIHPLVLGAGRRLFDEGAPPTGLRLVNSVTTSTGVVIATYQPSGPAPAPGAA